MQSPFPDSGQGPVRTGTALARKPILAVKMKSSSRSFDKESQRSIEEVDTLTIYPASEIILNQPRIEHGLRNMEEDYEKLSQKFKKEKKYDQEARLRKEMDRVREELRELHMLIGVEGYLPYFYENTECILDYFPEESMIYLDEPKHIRERADAFYLEFSESMKSRLKVGIFCLNRQIR